MRFTLKLSHKTSLLRRYISNCANDPAGLEPEGSVLQVGGF